MSDYYKDQIITYIGNKRKLVSLFKELFESRGKDIIFFDGFAGSGIVSRVAKGYASKVYCNDWEYYSYVINKCYLGNPGEGDVERIKAMIDEVNTERHKTQGASYIYKHYSPVDDTTIKPHERVFFSSKNGRIIDNMRHYIENNVPEDLKLYILAPLLYESSVKNNTCGYFNSYYKDEGVGKLGGKNSNDLGRICKEIKLPYPVLLVNDCEVVVSCEDTNEYVKHMPYVDIAYYDPPYNKHPYGTFYFMLNEIAKWDYTKNVPENFRGQDNDWQRSDYNSFSKSKRSFETLIENTKAGEIWVSYNNNGIIPIHEMESILKKYGVVEKVDIEHKTYNRLLGQGDKFRTKKNKAKITESLFILKTGQKKK
jgi:adenine-specific DNA-methyltransferase